MPKVELDDVERYLMDQAKKTPMTLSPTEHEVWLQDRFAELRAREAAKEDIKPRT